MSNDGPSPMDVSMETGENNTMAGRVGPTPDAYPMSNDGGQGPMPSVGGEGPIGGPREPMPHTPRGSGSMANEGGEGPMPSNEGEPHRLKWHEWAAMPNVREQYQFENGERIFQFSDRGAWKPFDRDAQRRLRALFQRMLDTQVSISREEEIN